MPRKDRLEVIKSIEEYRKSRVLVYFLGDRPNLFTVIADDSVSVINEHLRKMGKMETLDVFLYTRGGIGMAPARIVSLIREYSKNLDILVPYRCLSGGTVMCCGANNIIMTAMAELSPVDASTSGPFNPQDRLGRNIQISVEDVRAYLELAASAGLKSEGMTL
jgi:ClpP class serine protease